MSFSRATGAPIDLPTASDWTRSYRTAHPIDPRGHVFGRDIIDQILAQQGCEGIRIYNAINDDHELTLVLVGVDALGNDMDAGIVADFSLPCPDMCGMSNPLNS